MRLPWKVDEVRITPRLSFNRQFTYIAKIATTTNMIKLAIKPGRYSGACEGEYS
jgi:hypothetical protein